MSYLKVNSTNLYYEEIGEGEPILLLNGIFMSTKSWGPISSVLAKKHRVILHDFRGQWQSEKTQGRYSFDMHAEDLYGLLKELNLEKVHLVGTSYGGEVAMAFAIKYGEMIKSLSIISSVSEIKLPLKLTAERWKNAAKTKNSDVFIKEWLGDTYSENFLRMTFDLLYPRLVDALKSFDFDASESLIDCFLALYDHPLTGELHKITSPTLIVAAELDTLKPPPYSEIIHRGIRNSEFHVVMDAGHAVVIEKPNEINTLITGFIGKSEI
jgi:3-oxoadipate enol-lactonase